MGLAAAKCVPRQVISQTGILRALLSHPSHHQQNNDSDSYYLTPVQVEFCQVALLAEQYRFAARALEGTWPRPAADSSANNNHAYVRLILRYFLLRGMIHVGCNDWTMATRCFWTCLSIPAEMTSALSIAAWKKMVLVQCLQMEDDDYQPSRESLLTPATEYAKSNHQQHYHHQQQRQDQQQPGGGGFSMMMGASGNSPGSTVAIMARGPLSLPKAVPSCFTRFLNAAASNSKQQQQKHQQHNQPEDMEHGSMIVQEDLGEPSSEQQQQQQQQQAQQPQQQEQPAYPAMGVRVYMDLVHAFLAGDREKFESLQQEHATLLQTDGNMGLVRQCETAMFHRQVYQLSRMYAVIPLTQLATKLKILSAEKTKELLEQLAVTKTCGPNNNNNNKKHCQWPSIEVEDDGMVVFDFEPSVSEEVSSTMEGDSTEQELDDNIQELMQLTKQVEGLDHNIVATPMYHAMVRRNNDAKMAGPRGVDEM